MGTEYFKHGIYSPFFPLQNAAIFIILTYLVPVLFTFYIQDVLKLEKNNSGARRWRFPDFMTTAQDGGKVVSLTHRPPYKVKKKIFSNLTW